MRRLPLGTSVVAALAAMFAVVVSGAPSLAGNPHGGGGGSTTPATAQATASVSGTTANLTAKVSRPASEVSAVGCVVASSSVSQDVTCRLVSSSRKGGTSYAATVSGLATGSYTFTATFTLTNSTTVRGSASFSVGSSATPSGAQSVCLSYGGTYSTYTNGWQCDAPAGAYSALAQACTGVSVWTTYTTRDKVSWISYSCSGVH